ncbi:MAG: helix-turn-helix transcriptional regulator [Lawsonibacter sp.]|jgi:transcriptional regulator with XRE-family HTH domain|nr:helix-turn-helix transcriptional regulator [Lawsonibacter sp.]
MFSKELFGQRILEQRKKSGETQKALAEVLGVGDTQVVEIEHGRATTSAERIALICRHYNISADYLLGLTDDPEPKYGVKP